MCKNTTTFFTYNSNQLNTEHNINKHSKGKNIPTKIPLKAVLNIQ